MKTFKELSREIEQLKASIRIGDVDNEMTHQLEDEMKDEFIKMVCIGSIPYHQIKELAYQLESIPGYEKWYA